MLDTLLLQNFNEVINLTLSLAAKTNGQLGSLAQVLVTSEHPDALALHIKTTKGKIFDNFKLQYYSCDGDVTNPLVIAFLLAQIEATFSSELQYEFALNSEDIRNVLTSFYLPEDRIGEVFVRAVACSNALNQKWQKSSTFNVQNTSTNRCMESQIGDAIGSYIILSNCSQNNPRQYFRLSNETYPVFNQPINLPAQ